MIMFIPIILKFVYSYSYSYIYIYIYILMNILILILILILLLPRSPGRPGRPDAAFSPNLPNTCWQFYSGKRQSPQNFHTTSAKSMRRRLAKFPTGDPENAASYTYSYNYNYNYTYN